LGLRVEGFAPIILDNLAACDSRLGFRVQGLGFRVEGLAPIILDILAACDSHFGDWRLLPWDHCHLLAIWV